VPVPCPEHVFLKTLISSDYNETGGASDLYSGIDKKNNRSLGYIESLDVSSNSISFYDFLSR